MIHFIMLMTQDKKKKLSIFFFSILLLTVVHYNTCHHKQIVVFYYIFLFIFSLVINDLYTKKNAWANLGVLYSPFFRSVSTKGVPNFPICRMRLFVRPFFFKQKFPRDRNFFFFLWRNVVLILFHNKKFPIIVCIYDFSSYSYNCVYIRFFLLFFLSNTHHRVRIT